MSGEDLENRGSEKNRANNTYSAGAGVSSSFFVEDEREAEWTAWLVPMFVVANVVVFLAAMYINNCPKHEPTGQCVASFLGRISFQPLRQNPLFGPSSTTLEKLGGLEWSKVVVNHQRWRLITCIWLHAGLVHLLTNMLSLIVIGIRLEHQFGFVRVGVLYLLSGFGGSLLSCLFIRGSISVGASGALFGLLGAMLSELITNWSIYTNKVAALLTILFIIVVNLAIGVLPHVDNFAHIGGFLTGFLLGFVLLARPHYVSLGPRVNVPSGAPIKSRYRARQYVLWLASLVLLVAGLTLSLMKLFRGENGNDQCRWCRYLSCVPTSRWTC